MPNWKTITIPVTTPTANIIPKSFKKNFAAARYFSSPVLSHMASIITMYRANPIEMGGNRKWKHAVSANCNLLRISTSMNFSFHPL